MITLRNEIVMFSKIIGMTLPQRHVDVIFGHSLHEGESWRFYDNEQYAQCIFPHRYAVQKGIRTIKKMQIQNI